MHVSGTEGQAEQANIGLGLRPNHRRSRLRNRLGEHETNQSHQLKLYCHTENSTRQQPQAMQ
jgi:hypothetical protein